MFSKNHRPLPKGPAHGLFKGQKTIRGGYVVIYAPNCSRAGEDGYAKRAYVNMEKMLGRPLTVEEIVDHKNRIRGDDRPENLRLFPNTSEHSKFHYHNGDIGRKGKTATSGSFKRGHPYYPKGEELV